MSNNSSYYPQGGIFRKIDNGFVKAADTLGSKVRQAFNETSPSTMRRGYAAAALCFSIGVAANVYERGLNLTAASPGVFVVMALSRARREDHSIRPLSKEKPNRALSGRWGSAGLSGFLAYRAVQFSDYIPMAIESGAMSIGIGIMALCEAYEVSEDANLSIKNYNDHL